METKVNQKTALEKTIENFEYYIKNADHSQPATLNLIIEDGLTEEENEYIESFVQNFESFEILNNEGEAVLSIDQLETMLSELKTNVE